LETSDAGLNCLEAIERELAEVLVHIVRRHSNRAPLARMPAPDPDALSRDIAELRESEKKVQGSLELIHGALAHVVDRLGLIEINMRKDVASARDAPPSGVVSADPLAPATTTASKAPIASEAPATPTTIEPASISGPTLSHLPIRPNLSRGGGGGRGSGRGGLPEAVPPRRSHPRVRNPDRHPEAVGPAGSRRQVGPHRRGATRCAGRKRSCYGEGRRASRQQNYP